MFITLKVQCILTLFFRLYNGGKLKGVVDTITLLIDFINEAMHKMPTPNRFRLVPSSTTVYKH